MKSEQCRRDIFWESRDRGVIFLDLFVVLLPGGKDAVFGVPKRSLKAWESRIRFQLWMNFRQQQSSRERDSKRRIRRRDFGRRARGQHSGPSRGHLLKHRLFLARICPSHRHDLRDDAIPRARGHNELGIRAVDGPAAPRQFMTAGEQQCAGKRRTRSQSGCQR